MKLKDKINKIPSLPGVYIMKDRKKRIIYIGKAKKLKQRVVSYFHSSNNLSLKTLSLISNVSDIEYILTKNEQESLILENELIKHFHPKYNIALRDDKTYPYIELTKEDFPRLILTRKKKKGNRYFGPFPDVGSLRTTLRVIQKIFPLRRCNSILFNKIKKNRNPQSCLDYNLKQCLAPCIGEISKEDYEEMVKKAVLLLKGKKEKLLTQLNKEMKQAADNLYFEKAQLLKEQIQDIQRMNEKVNLTRVFEIKKYLSQKDEVISAMKGILKLKVKPKYIEGVDISNIAGKQAVGSIVVFKDGWPDFSLYRRFKIKMSEGINDVKMINEVIQRRFKRLIEEKKPFPNLLLVDGGIAQLNIVKKTLKELKIDDKVSVISLSKKEERLYLNNHLNLKLDLSSPVIHLLQHIRDEAHRFAVQYHKKIRRKNKVMNLKNP